VKPDPDFDSSIYTENEFVRTIFATIYVRSYLTWVEDPYFGEVGGIDLDLDAERFEA
jgi:hypothetical protein